MARKQISEALFKKIVGELEKLGIKLSEVLGTRTGVQKIGRSLTRDNISRFGIESEFRRRGADKILQLFREDARYLHQMNELEGSQFLTNIKVANEVINPAPLSEAGIFSLKEGKKLTVDEFAAKKAADQGKIDSATLKAAMETSKVDQDLAKKLKLDMSKVSDYEKLQAWKKQHNLPDFGGEEGLASLFKTRKQNELADLGTQLDGLEAEGKSLAEQAQKLADMAWKMSPEGMATEEAARKALIKRSMEGKGFEGGIFGARSDGFYRAIVRPFLIAQHEKGNIKLAENTLNSLKNADDLKGGGDFMSADPVRVFRQHYGDDAFDLIPNLEAFGGGQHGPTSQEKINVLEKVIGKPILEVGPDNPGGYLTKGEYQGKLDYEDETIRIIKEGDGRFGEMSAEEIAAEIAETNARKNSIQMAMDIDYPKVTKTPLNLRLMKNFDQPLTDDILAQEGYNLQEIGVLKNARNRMMTGEEMHPNEALLREKENLADEAGIDIDELKLDIDWGDMTPEPMAQGGGVGSLFKETNRVGLFRGTGGALEAEAVKYAGKTMKQILDDLMKHKKIRNLVENVNKKLHETGITKMWYENRTLDKKDKIVAEKILAPFVETVDKMTPWKTSSKSSRQSTLAWFREELTNPEFKKVYHPDWGEGRTVYRGEKSKKNLEYSEKNPSNMFQHGENVDYMFNPENVGSFASKDPSQAISYATKAEGFPHVKKIHLDPIDFQEAVERNVIENPYGSTSDVILNAEQKAALKTDLLATGIAAAKKYWPFNKGGLVSRQTLYENGVGSMFRRV